MDVRIVHLSKCLMAMGIFTVPFTGSICYMMKVRRGQWMWIVFCRCHSPSSCSCTEYMSPVCMHSLVHLFWTSSRIAIENTYLVRGWCAVALFLFPFSPVPGFCWVYGVCTNPITFCRQWLCIFLLLQSTEQCSIAVPLIISFAANTASPHRPISPRPNRSVSTVPWPYVTPGRFPQRVRQLPHLEKVLIAHFPIYVQFSGASIQNPVL